MVHMKALRVLFQLCASKDTDTYLKIRICQNLTVVSSSVAVSDNSGYRNKYYDILGELQVYDMILETIKYEQSLLAKRFFRTAVFGGGSISGAGV